VHGGGSSLGLGVGGWSTQSNDRHVKSRGAPAAMRGAGGIYPSSGGTHSSSSSSMSSSTSRRPSPSRLLSEKRAIDQLNKVKRYDADGMSCFPWGVFPQLISILLF
jgi:hypothetical protein